MIEAKGRRPVIALFFNRLFIKSLGQQPAPPEAISYLRSAEAEGITAYFCSVEDINPTEKSITGWAPDLLGRFRHTSVPWPDFFYDQGKDMSRAERAQADSLRKTIRHMVVPINSRRFLDKWLLHQALRDYRPIRNLLPDTSLCSQPQHLQSMIRRHQAVVAKPTNSSRGRGISLITRTERGTYRVESAAGEVVDRLNLREAFQMMLRNARRESVILQQRLSLLEVGARRFDLRMLMGKNSDGQWIVVSPRLRLGQENRFITNTSRGADRLPLRASLGQVLGANTANQLFSKAESLALLVCQYIERSVGPMGEVGLDFILDRNHRFWFIEGNPQPGKTPMPGELQGETPLLYRHIMAYCAYLWRQASLPPGSPPE